LLQRTLRVEQQEQQLRGAVLIMSKPKTEAGIRTLALPPFLVAELETHLARFSAGGPDDRLFTGDKGGPLRRQVLQGFWNDARKAAGMPKGFRFHDLRHTANTLTAATGASTAELMRRLGHASPAAALRYQHATEDRDRAIADLLGEHIEAAGRASEGVVRSVG
jgi:integrase